MRRRDLLLAGAACGPLLAWAHHSWSSFDLEHPLYLEGKVTAVRWHNPHAELKLEPAPGLKLPADLAARPLPAQSSPVDGKALLAKAALPTGAPHAWEVELAPLTRMAAWKLEPIAPGTTVSVVGFPLKEGQGAGAVLRAEYLFVGGRAIGLRSSPA